ncbi:MAG: efflux RND transporter permease subunit [Gammaproteobacteria bacterium]|nr:efflux RND transporter permease subunit [Gammaproteobacteria bacterium]MCF6260403.1 efflux RND transporter permease subunit [Gammaproteobacteria bacterium]
MKLTRLGLGNPVAVVVGVLLAIMFGLISLDRLPVQLTPEVELPEITITTVWRAAAPEEVESEIVEPQEDVLRGLPGMTKILARAQRGRGSITLTFQVGTDLRRALLEVLSRLNRVQRYPADANEPVINSIGGRSRAIAWFILKPVAGNDRDVASYQNYVEEVVQTRFERIPGVAMSEVRGGRESELRITFDPYKAASLGIELPRVAQLAGGAKNTSGGFADVGKRRYTLRFAGQYNVDDLGEMVLEWREGQPVYLRDVADIDVRMVDRTGFVIQNGQAAMAVNAHRETGVNVLEVMAGLRQAAEELREGSLKRAGLSFEQVYDETRYIDRSINMVSNNLLLGILLAVGVLWWFFRKFRATLMVAVAIPICVVSTFMLLDATGRTLNVISLAGLAFAVGMVLDAAIVVLESIVRLRERGMSSAEAADEGTRKVWGALLASTATTVAIFLPIVFLKDEAGQLFADLALTIAATVSISLLVAVTVLPAAASTWLRNINMHDPHAHWWDAGSNFVMRLTDTPRRRALWILGLITLPLMLAVWLKPEADFLPNGNRNLVFAFILPPPGSSVDTLEKELGQVVAQRMQPYVDGTAEPAVDNYFFVAFGSGVFMGARTIDPDKSDELVPLINRLIGSFPDTIAFAQRSSLFGGFGGGRTVDIDIQGSNIDALLDSAQAGFSAVMQTIPGRPPRPRPGLSLAEPELRLLPDERRISEAGWARSDVSQIIRALGDGLFVGDYFDGQQRLDIILRGQDWQTPEELAAIPLATPNSGVLPLSELTEVVRTAGPDEIRRLNRRRTITLEVKAPEGMSLEQTMLVLKEEVNPKIEPLLPEDGEIHYSGTAEKLDLALKSMSASFLLAIAILYLLMSALFRSFRDSLLVILAIPLATVGGVLALHIVNLFTTQHMDLLTMIGFIILLGLVVNNAILLVYQTRTAEREGLKRRDAVNQAVHLRLRPILMSTLTSIFGMLPLLLIPGAGTELYRGLAAVIVGGMSVSTVFTLILLPSLLRIGEDAKNREVKTA